VTFARVAQAAGVSRSWLYTQPDISAQLRRLRQTTNDAGSAGTIPAAQRATDESLRARLAAALDRNRQLADENARLRRQLAEHSATSGRHGPDQVTIQRVKPSESGRERPVGDTVHDGTPQVTAMADAKAQDNQGLSVRTSPTTWSRSTAPCCRPRPSRGSPRR